MFWKRKNNDIGSDIFFQNSNDLLIIVNNTGRIMRINQTCKRIFGYEPEELVGTNVMDLVHPDDMERANRQITNLNENAGKTLTFKNKATHKDGSTRWLQWSTCVKKGIMYATGTDVTRQEEKLRNLENFRRQYVSGKESNIGLWELDVETREFYGDEHVYEILGAPFKIKQRLRDLSYVLTPDSKLLIEKHIEMVLQSKLFEDFDCDIVRPNDKQIRNISVSGNFIFDENFNVKSFFGTIQDITEQKEIVNSFTNLANQQRTILDALEVVVILTIDGNIQWMNKSEFIGYSTEDINKFGFSQMFKSSTDYKFIIDEGYKQMRKGLKFVYEFEARHKNGSIAWLHITGKIQKNKSVIWTLFDISELKHSQYVNNLLVEAINQSSSEFIIYDKQLVAIYANNQSLKAHNCKVSDIIGKTFDNLEPSSDQKQFILDDLHKNNCVNSEYKINRGNTVRWYSLKITPILNRGKETIGYVSVKNEISARKNMEIELKNALNKAEQSDKIKEGLLQNLSHEVRTPLNAISGFSEIISTSDDLSMDNIKSYTNLILQSSHQLLGIITDMLVMSDIQQGTSVVSVTEINPNDLMEHLYNTFLSQAEDKNIELIYCIPQNTSTNIFTDETKLVQILSNLLTNALKFTPKGKISFGYTINDKKIEFFVIDTGIGISKENQKLIFDRFYQVDKNKANNFGTGLGLAISKSFAKMLNGQLSVESEVGKGTTFYLSLPLNK